MPTSLLAGLGGLIGGAGALLGGSAASDAAKEAAKTQMAMYNSNKAIAQPWIGAGQNALGIYGNAIGLNGAGAQQSYFNNFQNDPYLAGIKAAGVNAIENSDLARGRGYGGNVLNDLNRYSMDLQKNAFDTRLGQIWNTAEAGRGAAGALAGQGTQAANAAGNYMTAAGAYTGQSYLNAANALNQGYANFNKAAPSATNNNLGQYFGPFTSNSFAP